MLEELDCWFVCEEQLDNVSIVIVPGAIYPLVWLRLNLSDRRLSLKLLQQCFNWCESIE
jgi:hypothetical protein